MVRPTPLFWSGCLWKYVSWGLNICNNQNLIGTTEWTQHKSDTPSLLLWLPQPYQLWWCLKVFQLREFQNCLWLLKIRLKVTRRPRRLLKKLKAWDDIKNVYSSQRILQSVEIMQACSNTLSLLKSIHGKYLLKSNVYLCLMVYNSDPVWGQDRMFIWSKLAWPT